MDERTRLENKALELIKQLTPEQLAEALRVALAADHKEGAQNG